jgi:hypothetical protein
MRAVIVAWFLMMSVALGAAPGDAAASGQIVLLSGLPGDVESDRDYQRRLGNALSVLEAAGVEPAAVHVLMHDAARAEIPPRWRAADVRDATRANFLALGAELAKTDAPVTVVAWGHGGAARDRAVFHVVGARLSAGDFADVAQGLRGPSRWILFFNGSGDFAKALAADRRDILASENEMPFTSDPVGLDVVLDAWKKTPAATLEQLARTSGPRIAQWYEDRSLARTEEPTFFPGSGEPVLLSKPADVVTPSSGLAQDSATPAASATPPSQAAPAASPSPAPLPAWQALERVKRDAYPHSDSVVLSRDVSYTFGENPAVTAQIEETTQILTAEGKSRGDFDLPFSAMEDVEFTALEVLSPSGRLLTLDHDRVHDSEAPSVPGYDTARRKIFSLPGVEPGAILHVRYRRVWKRFPFPYIFLELPIGDEIPVVRSSLRVEIPRTAVLRHGIAAAPAQAPTVSDTSYARRYDWHWADLPAYRPEVLAAPGANPRVQLSTFPDWKTFGDWYARLIREADTVTDDIRAQAAAITAGLATPEEKVRALYEFVTGMRYVSIPLGVNSFRPHAAANVLRNRYGDCKDKANLLNTLLGTVGIPAKLVLVPRFGEVNPAVPGLAFNHAISRVDLPSGPIWVDSTDDVCPFGMLPPGDPGREVLVIDGQPDSLERLPVPDPQAHRIDVAIATPGPLALTGHGYAAYRLREAARESDYRAGTLPLLEAAQLEPVSGVFVSTRETHSDPSKLDGSFHWKADGAWTAATSAPFLLPAEWSRVLQPRSQPLLLNAGFPVLLRETVRLPARGGDVPAANEEKSGPLRWKLTWRRDGRELIGDLQVTLAEPHLSAPAAKQFQAQVLRLRQALAVPIPAGSE